MRNVTRTLWIIIGAALVLDAVVMACLISVNAGILGAFVIGVLYLAYGLWRDRISAGTRRGPLRWVKFAIFGINALMLALFAFIAVFGRVDTASDSEDAVIVLGTGLNGEEVTPALAARLDVAVDYSRANPDAVIVVSGGQGPDESITEALAMQRYLAARGVADSRIIQEGKSTSTSENFAFSKQILDARLEPGYTTAFVTTDYHVFRSSRIASGAGLPSAHLHANTPWYQAPVDYVREFLATAKFVTTGR